MTVQELINELQKVKDKNLKVKIQKVDSTNWVCYNEVEEVGEQNVFNEKKNKNIKTFVIN